MTVLEAVRDRLCAVMKDKKIIPNQICINGGIAKSTISQILNLKQQKITVDILHQILSTIGMSFKDFFDDPIFDEISD